MTAIRVPDCSEIVPGNPVWCQETPHGMVGAITKSPSCRAPILLLPVELDRPSMRKGFALRLADDDPYVNITLLEKLKVDFPHVDTTGLDQLPEDGSGLDIALIVRRYREQYE